MFPPKLVLGLAAAYTCVLFADEKLKRLPLSPEELMAEATQIERPGKPPPPKGVTTAPPELPAISPSAGLSVMQPANAGERKRKQAGAR